MVESHAHMPIDIHLFDADLARIRAALNIPRQFSPEALAQADSAASRNPLAAGRDESFLALPFLTLSSSAGRREDRAFYAERSGSSVRLFLAVADVGFFVDRASAIEAEAWRRGLTFSSPDLKTPLYPPRIGELSGFVAGEVRPAIVFAFDLDERAGVRSFRLARGVIRSRAHLSANEAGAHLARERESAGSGALAGREWSESLKLLEQIGRTRKALARERGGLSLPLLSEPWRAALSGYRIPFDEGAEVESWMEQISLLAGTAGGTMMAERGAGLLRALDAPRPDRLRSLRLTAAALGVDWPMNMEYGAFIGSLNPREPRELALLHQAASVCSGARYVTLDGGYPTNSHHAAIGAHYANLTAPLRRLADRYALDLLLDLAGARKPDAGLLQALGRLPQTMQAAEYRAKMLESAILNFAEACLLKARVGEVFRGMVVDRRRDGVEVQIADPPLRAAVRIAPTSKVQLRLGEQVPLRLEGADPAMRSVRFVPLNARGETMI